MAPGPEVLVRFRDVEKTYDGRVNVVDRLIPTAMGKNR